MSYQFKPSWLVSSFFFIVILGLLGLGGWQLKQADRQQNFQSMIDQRTALAPLSLNMPFDEFAPYQTVHATGQYLIKDSILLDNITYDEKPGFYLITPFKITASNSIILVNRGWLPKEDNKEELPNFKTPLELITLKGHLNYSPSKPIEKESFSNPISPTPPLWHYMDENFFAQINGYSVLPLMLNLKEGSQTNTLLSSRIPPENIESALVQDWPNYDAKSDTHLTYSALWFFSALIGLVIYLGLGFKKIN